MRKKIARDDFLYEGQVSDDVCNKLIQLHEDIPYLTDETKERDDYSYPFQKAKGISGAGYNTDIKDSVDVNISHMVWHVPSAYPKVFDPYIDVCIQYHQELSRVIRDYVNSLWVHDLLPEMGPTRQDWQIREGVLIQKYQPNQGFKRWHYERGHITLEALARELVFMTYLNDVPDGGTEFFFQKKTIKAEKGKTLIWPAAFTHTHRGQISKKHVKYIVTGWIHDNYQHLREQ